MPLVGLLSPALVVVRMGYRKLLMIVPFVNRPFESGSYFTYF